MILLKRFWMHGGVLSKGDHMSRSIDIIDALDDLILQATTERSHYYVKAVSKHAKEEILKLRIQVGKQKKAIDLAVEYLQFG